MVRIRFNPEKLEIDIRGHSGYAKNGSDIVCAGVSTLFYTLVETLFQSSDMLIERPYFKDSEGRGLVSCKPKPEYEGNIYRTYQTILIGFEVLQKNFPKNVKFILTGVASESPDKIK